MIALVIAVLFLYFISVPIKVSAAGTLDGDADYIELKIKVFFITVFHKRIRLSEIKEYKEKSNETKDAKTKIDKNAHNRKIITFLLSVMRKFITVMRVEKLALTGMIGAGDAAVTAVAASAINIAFEDLAVAVGRRDMGNIKPNYDEETVFIDFSGIISFGIGDIIYAVCAVVIEKATARGGKKGRSINGNVTG